MEEQRPVAPDEELVKGEAGRSDLRAEGRQGGKTRPGCTDPGCTGRLVGSGDYGGTWKDRNLPGELNSTTWTVATHPFDPKLIFVCSNLGQIFRSTDGGESWVKLPREFGEVRSTLWQPLQ